MAPGPLAQNCGGAKRYLWVFGALVGYFALTAARMPQRHAGWLAGLFFVSGTTAIMSDLALAGGRAFYWLFMFFPTDVAFHQHGNAAGWRVSHRATSVGARTKGLQPGGEPSMSQWRNAN